MSLEIVPVKVGRDSRASSEPWARSPEQGMQASTATLRVAATQRVATTQGCLEGKGAMNRDDMEPAPPPRINQAPAPIEPHLTMKAKLLKTHE